jgi:hypothetical protein
MYRPHEAREDTVLFPALREIVSEQEFGALGEDFEKKVLKQGLVRQRSNVKSQMLSRLDSTFN